jgi:hypothetical protein
MALIITEIKSSARCQACRGRWIRPHLRAAVGASTGAGSAGQEVGGTGGGGGEGFSQALRHYYMGGHDDGTSPTASQPPQPTGSSKKLPGAHMSWWMTSVQQDWIGKLDHRTGSSGTYAAALRGRDSARAGGRGSSGTSHQSTVREDKKNDAIRHACIAFKTVIC